MKKIKSILIIVALILITIPQITLAQTSGKRVLTRPNSDTGPTEVQVAVWLIDIDSIDSSAQTFVANAFLSLYWKDPALAHNNTGFMRYNLDDIWSPTIQIVNEIGIVRQTMPRVARVDSDGNVYYRQRYIGPFSQPLNLENFPFDKHTFRLHFASVESGPKEIKFTRNEEWLKDGLERAGGIAGDISLPDWKIVSYDTSEVPYVLSPKIQAAGYVFDFVAARDIMHYVWKVFLPLIIIVMMSWSVFWIDPSNSGTQIGVATTTMLTLIAYRFAIDSQVPKVPYMTKLDQFIVVGTILIFMALAQVVLTSWLAYKERPELARKIDRVSRYVFPILFVIVLSISLIY